MPSARAEPARARLGDLQVGGELTILAANTPERLVAAHGAMPAGLRA
jgi:hypothetical protein